MIPREAYDAYLEALEAQHAGACSLLRRFIESLDWSDASYEALKANRDACIRYAIDVLGLYGENAAESAAQFYEAVAEAEGVSLPSEAIVAPVSEDGSVWASGRSAARALWGGSADVPAFAEGMEAMMRKHIKKAANATIAANAMHDRHAFPSIRWARVPQGAETCPFCIMLASRGFVYVSERSAELFDHEHDHCDCKVVVSFDEPGLEGYDHLEYEEIYARNFKSDDYGHVDTAATLNSMRREVYPEQKDRINAQKRAAYARRKEASDGR